jgi:catechol 2,3-dioxygenase-like lactoylglutathione lyase family enzyme
VPLVRRLLESALYCEDLQQSHAFYRDVLGLGTLFADDRLVALDAGSGTVLLLFRRGASASGVTFPGGWIPPHDGGGPVHLALAVDADQLAALEQRLLDAGISVESRVTWARGGRSLYFRDPEGHSVECATPGVWLVY